MSRQVEPRTDSRTQASITRETAGTSGQTWGRARAPRSRDTCSAATQAARVVPLRRPHQGFFTVRPSSFRKPFCSIHLSLRNLDLRASGGQQGLAEALPPSLPIPRGTVLTESPAPLPRPQGSRRDPKRLAGAPGRGLGTRYSRGHQRHRPCGPGPGGSPAGTGGRARSLSPPAPEACCRATLAQFQPVALVGLAAQGTGIQSRTLQAVTWGAVPGVWTQSEQIRPAGQKFHSKS